MRACLPLQANNRNKKRAPIDVPKKEPKGGEQNEQASELLKMFKKRRNVDGEQE